MIPCHIPFARTVLLIRLAVFLVLAGSKFIAPASAQDTIVLLRGPYLQVRTATSIVVRWRTDQDSDSVVRCGTEIANLNRLFVDFTPTNDHQVTLTNLQPATKYFYEVGITTGTLVSDGDTFVTGGTDNFFVTAPAPGTPRPTRIWFVSDYGFYNEGEIAVRDSYFNFTAASGPADVWLTGGDNDQRTGRDDEEQESIFETYAPLLRNLAIWPTLGNHDTYTASDPGPFPFYDNFTLPANGEAGGTPSGSERYYSFDYGDIHFICLDSITPELSISPDTPMFQWLREDLSQTPRKWKIAYWHGPPYTKGSHNSDYAADPSARMTSMRQNALPILESHGVDLVLSGHSHVYERSCLLHGQYGFSWDFSPTNRVDGGDGQEEGTGPYRQVRAHGTVYVVAAVGGYPFGFYYGRHPAHVVNIGAELGSCMIDVNDDRLDFKFINAATNVLDHFTLLKGPPDRPRLVGIERADEFVRVVWNSQPGECYQIWGQEILGHDWILVADQVRSQGTVTEWWGNWQPGAESGYFRIATCPP